MRFPQVNLTRSVSTAEGLDTLRKSVVSQGRRNVSIVENSDTTRINAVSQRNRTMVHQDKISRKKNRDSNLNWKAPHKWKLTSAQSSNKIIQMPKHPNTRNFSRDGQKGFLDVDDDDLTIIAPIIRQTNVWYSSKKMFPFICPVEKLKS